MLTTSPRAPRYSTSPDHQGLARAAPRVHLHFTPTYSSWLNLVERFFAYVTSDLLQRGDRRSVQALEADIRAWVKSWNANPKAFVWTKTADVLLAKLGRLIRRASNAGH